MTIVDQFFYAVEDGRKDEVARMIANGFNLNTLDEFGYSALHASSANKQDGISELLIKAGIDVNRPDKNHATILHYVAEYGQLEIAKLALERGADLSIADRYGNQPLWTAVFNDKGRNVRAEMVELFVKNGADPNHKNNVGKSPKDFAQQANCDQLMQYLEPTS